MFAKLHYVLILFIINLPKVVISLKGSIEDCDYQEQFFYQPKSECRNCSDVSKLFSSYQEWLGKEATNNDDYNHQGNNKLFNNQAVNDVVLSKLISIDQQDSETSDYNNNNNQIDSSEVNYGESYSFNQDTNPNKEDYINSGSILKSLQLIKQTEKFVNRFIRSSLIEDELLIAIDQCRQQANTSACQMWSNLCAMTMYSHSTVDNKNQPSTSDSFELKNSQSPSSQFGNKIVKKIKKINFKKTWQDCVQFNVNTICNSLREWFRIERKSSVEMHNIFALSSSTLLDDQQLIFTNLTSAVILSTTTKLLNSIHNSNLILKLNQPIQLLIYKYAFNGKFLGIDQFGLNEMERFCLISDNNKFRLYPSEENYIRVGKNKHLNNCKFNSFQAYLAATTADNYGISSSISGRSLTKFNQTVFIDLFIGFPLNGALFIKPVPILIRNLLFNGKQTNRKNYDGDYTINSRLKPKLVHRFFLNSIVNLETNSISTLNQDHGVMDLAENVLIYAESVLLDIKFKKKDTSSTKSTGIQLHSILLTIDYNFIPLNITVINNQTNTYDYYETKDFNHLYETKVSIVQTLTDMLTIKNYLDLFVTLISIVSIIWSLVKCYKIQKCYGIIKLDLKLLQKFIIIFCDTIANSFTLITFIFLSYLFLLLKVQSSTQMYGEGLLSELLMAPSDEFENTFIMYLKVAFLFKLIGLTYKLYTYLNIDIFFIDWERPKMLTSSQIMNYTKGKITSSTINDNQQLFARQQDLTSTPISLINNDNKQSQLGINEPDLTGLNKNRTTPYHQQSLSFWRPYTVINRWLQLQTFRRQDLTIQLILFVCFMELTQLLRFANSDSFLYINASANNNPISEQSSERKLVATSNTIFRMLILSLVYLILSFGQILYKKYFHELIMKNSINEFVDLCSVANVSLFSMLYPRFGYYIHGRNANGSGECGIAEMSALLEREERDLCSKRGLELNSDQQTFTIILPKIINDHYKKLLFRDNSLIKAQSNNNNIIQQQLMFNNINNKQAQQVFGLTGRNLLKSALNLSQLTQATSFSANRTIVESIVARNKAINSFLINFLEHFYKEIDYSIRDQRRFENFLFDIDLIGVNEDDDYDNNYQHLHLHQEQTGTETPTMMAATISLNQSQLLNNNNNSLFTERHIRSGAQTKLTLNNFMMKSATKTSSIFWNDYNNSFAKLLWIGLEFDLILKELLFLLMLDYWLDKPPLIITTSLVWLLNQILKTFYTAYARTNLITKAMVDEKFIVG